jgi:hypothetical protein
MKKTKATFEQISVEVVKNLAEISEGEELEIEECRPGAVAVETPAMKTEPYSVNIAMQRRNRV